MLASSMPASASASAQPPASAATSAATPTATCGPACNCSPAISASASASASPRAPASFLGPDGQLLTHAEAVKRGLVIRSACECCRDRKLKCDGRSAEQGGCLRCERSGVSCHYAARDPIGRPRKRPLGDDVKPRKRKSKKEQADAAALPSPAGPTVPTPPTEASRSVAWSPGWPAAGPDAAPPAPGPTPALPHGNMPWPPLLPGPQVLPPVPEQDPQGASPPASLSDLGLAAFLRSLDVLQIERSDLVRLGQDLAGPSTGSSAPAATTANGGEKIKPPIGPTDLQPQPNTMVLDVPVQPPAVPLLPLGQTNMSWPYPLPAVNAATPTYNDWMADLDPERLFAGSAILDPRIAYAVPADFSWWNPGDLSSFPGNLAGEAGSAGQTGDGIADANEHGNKNDGSDASTGVNTNANGHGHVTGRAHVHPSPPGASPASFISSSPSSVLATPRSFGVHHSPGDTFQEGKKSDTALPPYGSSCCAKSKAGSDATSPPSKQSCCAQPPPKAASCCSRPAAHEKHYAQPTQVKPCCAKSTREGVELQACCSHEEVDTSSKPCCSGCSTRDQAAAIGAQAAATAAARLSPPRTRMKVEPSSPASATDAAMHARDLADAHPHVHSAHRNDHGHAHRHGEAHGRERRVHCVPNPHGPGCTCLCDTGVALISIERNVATASEAPSPRGNLARSVQLTLHTSQAVSERCACSASCPTCRSSPTAQTSATLLISTALQIYAKAVQTLRTGVGGALGLGLEGRRGELALDVKIGDWRPSDVNARKIALYAMKLELRDLRAALGRVAQVASSASTGTSLSSLNPSNAKPHSNLDAAPGPVPEHEPEKRLSIHAVDQLVIRKLHLQLGEILTAVENLEKA